MAKNSGIDPNKLNAIKYRILAIETDNIVKKESNPAMEEKIRKIIISEVEKK